MPTKGISELLGHKFNLCNRKSFKSPFASLLRSNDAPSGKKSTLIQAIAGSSRGQGSNKACRHYSHNSDSYSNSLESLKGLLSASRRLPTELLIEILLQFHFAEQRDDPSQNDPPWILTHVCRRWRHITINMPALWRELPPFHLGSSDKNELKRRIECLSTLLVRSFPEKLTFFLSKKETPRTDDKILFMLFKHSERWERISLVISEDVCAQFSRVKGHISSLRSLKLFISRTGRLHVDMFEVAPKLEEVYLSSTPWAGSMRLPWHQLGCFTEESTENNHLHYILKEARELKNLDITFHKDSFDGFDAIPHVTFRQLTTLVVQCFAAWQFYINPLFDKLTLPALQELVFRGHCPTSYVSSLALMIRRSACTLQKLTLHNYCILASELESILLLTPSLSHLAIANPTIEVLELFQRDEQAPVHQWTLVPHLQSLTACLDDESSDLNALKHFARARCDLIFHSVSCAIHGRPTELETFRIIPSTRHDFLNYAEHFGSPATKFDILKSATSYNIAVTNNTIDVHIRKIQLTNTDPEMSRKSRSNAVSREVGNVISLLEHLEITPEMVVYLYLKRVKHRISQLLLDVQMPTDSKINFSRRLDALLPLWTSVLNQVSSELRWGWEKEGGLIYIPEDDRNKNRNLVSFDFNVRPPARVSTHEEHDDLF